MTTRPCPMCGAALAPGAALCDGCVQRTRMRLRAIPDLLVELDLAVAKLTSPGDGGVAGNEDRLAFDPVASEAAHAIRASLGHWVHVWANETADRPTWIRDNTRVMTTVSGQAGILTGASLAGRPWAPQMADDIRAVTEAGWRAVDTPPAVTFAGWCPMCHATALYAPESAPRARCGSCGGEYDVEATRAALVAAADDVCAPRITIARALQIPLDTMRDWCRSRPDRPPRLAAVGINRAGQPVYRVSDVQVLKAEWLTSTHREPRDRPPCAEPPPSSW